MKLTLPAIAKWCGIIGALSVMFGMAAPANLIWMIGNPLWVIHARRTGDTNLEQMMIVYTVFAATGVIIHLMR